PWPWSHPCCQCPSPRVWGKIRPPSAGPGWGTDIATVDQVEDSRVKMSTCGVGLVLAGLVGLACGSSGLKARGSSAGAGGVVKGGQAASTIESGTTGGTGGTIGTGGAGGAGIAGASGNTGGTGGCSRIDCHMPACAGEFQPNPDPCGCAVI